MSREAYLIMFFLLINFGGLALGGWLMDEGASSNWYMGLNKAPWTPPGWVFGVAWTIIMALFSIYLAVLFSNYYSLYILRLFLAEFLLNVSWNYVFFNKKMILLGLIIIILLTSLIFYFFFMVNRKKLNNIRWLLMPYMVWLCIATSLNLYILLHN